MFDVRRSAAVIRIQNETFVSFVIRLFIGMLDGSQVSSLFCLADVVSSKIPFSLLHISFVSE